MRLLKVIRCLIKFKGHKYKYNVSLEGNAVIARKDCERCGYFEVKVDDGK